MKQGGAWKEHFFYISPWRGSREEVNKNMKLKGYEEN